MKTFEFAMKSTCLGVMLRRVAFFWPGGRRREGPGRACRAGCGGERGLARWGGGGWGGGLGNLKKCLERIKMMQKEGRSIILVTHDTSTVENFCDSAVVLDHGKLLAQGETKSVVVAGRCVDFRILSEQPLGDFQVSIITRITKGWLRNYDWGIYE